MTRPLAGVRVVVTRARHQAGATAEAFAAAGADVVLLPLLEVGPPADPRPLAQALAGLATFDAVALTSTNAVAATAEALRATPTAQRPRIATVGPATAAAVGAAGLPVDIQARRHDGKGLFEALVAHLDAPARVLVPQADDAHPALAGKLARAGFTLERVEAYRKRLPATALGRARRVFADRPLGWVTFTSPRIVRHFVALMVNDWRTRRPELRAVAIGATTAEALRAEGVTPYLAPSPSAEGLVEAVIRAQAGATADG